MGVKQLSFSDCELTTAEMQTKRQKFLPEMELVILECADRFDRAPLPQEQQERRQAPYPLATMLRIYL